MKNKLLPLIHIFVTPFAVSAAIEFLPGWVSWPIAVLGGILWFGSLIMLSNEEKT